jgi:hypothetical protein
VPNAPTAVLAATCIELISSAISITLLSTFAIVFSKSFFKALIHPVIKQIIVETSLITISSSSTEKYLSRPLSSDFK